MPYFQQTLEHFWQDLRFGARLLLRSPMFAAMAILSLALGIGATTAICSLINVIVLRPLPVAEPHNLYIAQTTLGRDAAPNLRFSYPFVDQVRKTLDARVEVAAQSEIEEMLVRARGRDSETDRAQVQLVSGEYFPLLRQQPQIGRLLGPDDNRAPGQHPVAVISHAYWTRRFGGELNVVGSSLIINNQPLTIVGVTRPQFFGTTVATRVPDLWVPIMMQSDVRYVGSVRRVTDTGETAKPWATQWDLVWVSMMLRVPPDAMTSVNHAMGVARQMEASVLLGEGAAMEERERLLGQGVFVVPGARGFSRMRTELATPLVVLLAIVGLLLALTCVNIASLLLARATNRCREMAIRLSIGARRARLVRQLLTESLMLAFAGGGLGLLVAQWGSSALLAFNREVHVNGVDVTPDWRVISLTFGLSALTAMLFGLLPALRSTRVPLVQTLKASERSVISSGGARGWFSLGRLLIISQMAFSLLLLIVAALFSRSLQEVWRVDVGFDRDRLLVARMDARSAGYAVSELPDLYRRLVERAAAVPGVASASLSKNGPFSGTRTRGDFDVEGYTRGPNEEMKAHKEWVTNDYFQTVGLKIVEGRALGPEDTAGSRRVSVINQTMAKRYFGQGSPIGKRWGEGPDLVANGFEVIGVVQDARYNDVKIESINMAYMPVTQSQQYLQSLEVRVARGDAVALAATLRHALRESEPRLLVASVDTLDERIARSLGEQRLLAWLTLVFSGMALCLTCLGLYGTISHAVARRTAELGLRMALGADRGAVQRMILGEALALVLMGLVIGLPLALFASRALGALLYGVMPWDPVAHGTAVITLIAVAALAAYLPARRASLLDPVPALRG